MLPAGEHVLELQVTNFQHVPSIWLKSKSLISNKSWITSNQDKGWYTPACEDFTDPKRPPSTFKLAAKQMEPLSIEETETGYFVDFGKETIGRPIFHDCFGKGSISLFYGESKEEALAGKEAETYEFFEVDNPKTKNCTIAVSRAYRYIDIQVPAGVSIGKISMLYDYLPLTRRGDFKCSDELINKIYDVSYYTMELCTREFMVDGIKRDRWIWSGDAYQSYLMNFYTFFDEPVNKRTLYAVRGQDPVKTHLNTILDYSFYWIIGIYDHYLFTGDADFVKEIYPRMKTLMDFCESRMNAEGFIAGHKDDWVFIDWAPMSKLGELCFEQILWARCLEAMAACSKLLNQDEDSQKYTSLYKKVSGKIDEIFWNEDKQAYSHTRLNGIVNDSIYKYPNMFAVLFDYASPEQKSSIKKNVLLNKDIQEITTPYMKFHELAALCELEEQETVTGFVKQYWGGMLEQGATSFWEAYDPSVGDGDHDAMYGRPFGKSLCHAWGDNPVYLFGKYYLGVKPTAPGYKQFEIRPKLGGIEWIEGKVPTPNGDISIKMNKDEIEVLSPVDGGTLILDGEFTPKNDRDSWTKTSEGNWEMKLSEKMKYKVKYKRK